MKTFAKLCAAILCSVFTLGTASAEQVSFNLLCSVGEGVENVLTEITVIKNFEFNQNPYAAVYTPSGPTTNDSPFSAQPRILDYVDREGQIKSSSEKVVIYNSFFFEDSHRKPFDGTVAASVTTDQEPLLPILGMCYPTQTEAKRHLDESLGKTFYSKSTLIDDLVYLSNLRLVRTTRVIERGNIPVSGEVLPCDNTEGFRIYPTISGEGQNSRIIYQNRAIGQCEVMGIDTLGLPSLSVERNFDWEGLAFELLEAATVSAVETIIDRISREQ